MGEGRLLLRQNADGPRPWDVEDLARTGDLLGIGLLGPDRGAVDGGGVVVLQRVLEQQLPVAADLVAVAADGHHLGQPVGGKLGRIAAEMGRKIGPACGEGDENKAVPDLMPHGDEGVVRGLEALDPVHVRRGGEAAVESVGPAVVGTDDRAAIARAVQQRGATMAAGIAEDA